MRVKIYVEGGGDSKALKTDCRSAFSAFFKKAGFNGRMPQIIACGSRSATYERFKTAIENTSREPEMPSLLVDSEEPITNSTKWGHLQVRDGWDKPEDATEDHVFLMVQCMEAWFLADRDALKSFYQHSISDRNLPDNLRVEQHLKQKVFQTLGKISDGKYSKGRVSFKILSSLDPGKVREASPRAEELLQTLENLLR